MEQARTGLIRCGLPFLKTKEYKNDKNKSSPSKNQLLLRNRTSRVPIRSKAVECIDCCITYWVHGWNVCGVWIMNQLDFVSDNLLSTNDAEVIAKKRENFKKLLEEVVNHWAYKDPKYLNLDSLVELIVSKTFDESVVN